MLISFGLSTTTVPGECKYRELIKEVLPYGRKIRIGLPSEKRFYLQNCDRRLIIYLGALQVAEALPRPAGHPPAQLQLRPGGEGDAGAAGQPALRHHTARVHAQRARSGRNTARTLPHRLVRG